MKRVAWAVVCLVLAGCVNMARFDSVQYNHWVELYTSIREVESLKACSIPSQMKHDIIPRMVTRISSIQTYIQYRPLPSGYGEVAAIVYANIAELQAAYATKPPSVAYCTTKLSIISDSVEQMLAVEGRRLE